MPEKEQESKTLQEALSRLAAMKEYWTLLADTTPITFVDAVREELRAQAEQIRLMEPVVEVAMQWFRHKTSDLTPMQAAYFSGPHDRDLILTCNGYHAARQEGGE